MTEHKKVSLSINGAQSVGFEKGTIEFKNYFRQIIVPFKVYVIQKALKVMKDLTQKRIKITFPVVLLTSSFVLMMNLPSQQLLLEVKMLLMNLLKQFLKSISIVKK